MHILSSPGYRYSIIYVCVLSQPLNSWLVFVTPFFPPSSGFLMSTMALLTLTSMLPQLLSYFPLSLSALHLNNFFSSHFQCTNSLLLGVKFPVKYFKVLFSSLYFSLLVFGAFSDLPGHSLYGLLLLIFSISFIVSLYIRPTGSIFWIWSSQLLNSLSVCLCFLLILHAFIHIVLFSSIFYNFSLNLIFLGSLLVWSLWEQYQSSVLPH